MQVNPQVRHLARGEYDFNRLDQNGKIIAEYIWIGGNGLDIRSKARTLNIPQVTDLSQLPEWNYDGSSTRQAAGHDSEVYLRPVKFYRDPFRGGNNVLVLCETYKPDGSTANTNFRDLSRQVFEQVAHEEPWYGFEQEYTIFRTDRFPNWPLGFPDGGFPLPQGPYYCSVGGDVCFGRQVMEAHYKCCLYCDLTISGTNAEVMPGQWEYQIGPVVALDAPDQLWMSRYLLLRVAEHFGVGINWSCKPIKGDWNGAGCHTNYSTNSTRANGGMDVIRNYCEKLGQYHHELISVYGPGNELRLTGHHETQSIDKFSYGVADRGGSIRIPRFTDRDGKGYLEDRRPASNMDPYVVAAAIADVTILNGSASSELRDKYKNFLKEI